MSDGAVCTPNIGLAGRRRRMRFGLIAVGIGVLTAAVVLVLRVPVLWRLVVLLPFWAGGTGIFQARDKT
jgi:hypothetical protein